MPRAAHRARRRPVSLAAFGAAIRTALARPLARSLVPALAAALALAAACADVAAPVTAPRPRLSGEALCWDNGFCRTPDDRCTADSDQCVCDSSGHCCVRYTFCYLAPDPAAPDTGPRRLRIRSAGGVNPEKSFTTGRGERALVLEADAGPLRAAPTVRWTLGDAPGDVVHPAAPVLPKPGVLSGTDVPRQSTARWRQPHGSPLSARALAYQVVAELPADAGEPALRDSVVVRQRELDVLRQEYLDFDIPVPAPSEIRTPGEVAGLTRFTWGQLNQGDYNLAVLTPVLLAKLDEVDAKSGRALSLSSVFRNPAHHRFHVTVSGGARVALLSQHQYGTAVDINTYRNLGNWNRLHDLVKRAGACAEPLDISTNNHVHADWRASAPACPPGW